VARQKPYVAGSYEVEWESRHIYPETGDGDRRIAYDAEDLIKAAGELAPDALYDPLGTATGATH
jgi:hypothetical protein